jgi:hypothetical protein
LLKKQLAAAYFGGKILPDIKVLAGQTGAAKVRA